MKTLPFNINITTKIQNQLLKTSRALAELKGYSNNLPNKNILLNAIIISEAKDSSEIENIVTTHDEIYKAMTSSQITNAEAKEIVNYRNALWSGFEQVKKDGFISTNTLVNIQSIIENSKAGIRKYPGTNLINPNTNEIIYTPPQSEEEIRNLLKNLEDFINNQYDNIDPLIKLPLIHYQFEMIHPFYDGNGRTGRILNILYLVLTNLLDSPILYLSRFINKNKNDYYKAFRKIEKDNDYEEFIIYMLKGIEITSFETMRLIMDIEYEMNEYKKIIRDKLPKIYSEELLNTLFYEVYTKGKYIEETCHVTRLTAASYLKQLEKIGLLESEKIGRDRIYKNTRLIKVLNTDLEIKLD